VDLKFRARAARATVGTAGGWVAGDGFRWGGIGRLLSTG